MDKFPLLLEGSPAGELIAEPEGLYTWFSARCPLPDGLWCAWAVGDRGELRLGVLEPEGTQGTIRRRFSRQLTAPLGRLLRGPGPGGRGRSGTWPCPMTGENPSPWPPCSASPGSAPSGGRPMWFTPLMPRNGPFSEPSGNAGLSSQK